MKVLIIGGTGTISSPITNTLSKMDNVELYVLNRGKKKTEELKGVKYLVSDIKDVERVKTLLKDLEFDVVINFLIMNLEDAKNNYEIFKDKTKQFIYISTVCVLNGPSSCNLNEDSLVGNCYSMYGIEKASAERFFLQKYKEDNFNVVIVRPTQTYSDHRIPLSVKGSNYWGVVSRMLKGKKVIVHGDGQSVWAGTHALDFSKAFMGLVNNEKANGEVYQIMNPEVYTWDMIYSTLARLLNVEYNPVYIPTDILVYSKKYDFVGSIQGDKRWSKIFDVKKINEVIPDLKFDIDMEKGLSMFIEYMDAHPEEKIEDEEFDKWCDDVIELYEKHFEILSNEML
ncbi:MAG: NAD-dependent epimerase/dehydratase family protein [Erysipelotrichaceae bacterium]|nr:NAD-dependent epimerase/dehydratase family protein [Erysipelotrichaceae bacterium]